VAQRHEREQARRGPVLEEVRVARMIAQSAAEVDSALDAEAWASHLLGTFREQRRGLPFPDAVEVDPALLFGKPLVTRLATLDDPAAMVALASIAKLDDGKLGALAAELLADSTPAAGVPRWIEQIGEWEIVGAAVVSEAVFDDARTVLLESRHPDAEMMAVGVLIDRNLGGLAKDVLLAESIEQVAGAMGRDSTGDEAELELEQIDPGIAAGLIRAAIARTDITWDPPVDDDFWPGRALTLLRADQTPGAVEPPEPAELSSEERDRLRDEFLASPEGREFAPDGDEAWVASLAIDFCAGYTDGDRLRWSPVVVELFMTDWIPRKVLATPELLDRLPAALDAWVRFAARRRGIPDWAANETRGSIGKWVNEMVEAALDPLVGGPSKQFLLAAKAAGVDLEDEQALGTFIKGWNARSELDLADLEVPQAIEPDEILQLKITLKGISKPPVWRRVQVRRHHLRDAPPDHPGGVRLDRHAPAQLRVRGRADRRPGPRVGQRLRRRGRDNARRGAARPKGSRPLYLRLRRQLGARHSAREGDGAGRRRRATSAAHRQRRPPARGLRRPLGLRRAERRRRLRPGVVRPRAGPAEGPGNLPLNAGVRQHKT
jgi:hypothetical protein